MSSTGGVVSAVTDITFAEHVLQSDKPVLVDFWAQWCGPCHLVASVLEEVARERAESLTVCKLNADENVSTAASYLVMSLPTLMIFRDGQPIQTLIGARPKALLLAEIDEALSQPRR